MDSVRVVRFTFGGQIEELLHIQSSLGFEVTDMAFERETLEFARGDRNQRMVKMGSRYGGERYAGESLSNGAYKFKLLAAGSTADAMLNRVALLIAELERVPGEHYIEHKMEGATYPSYYEVRAPAKFSPVYKALQAVGAGSMGVDVEWPVAPLVCGPPMHCISSFGTPTDVEEYSLDAGTIEGFSNGSFSAALTTERRFVHTGRGYTYGSHQVVVKGQPGATIASFKLAAILKRTAPDTYIDCYVDDNGTNSRLRIDTVVDGTRTNRATTNLAARVSNGTALWIRARIENDAITVDHFTSNPAPATTPTTTRTYTLTGGDATALGASVQGIGGGEIVPQHASARLETIAITPYVYASTITPVTLHIDGEIPGDAPAKGGIEVAPISATTGNPAVFAMFGWSGRETDSAPSPFGLYDSANASALVDMSSTSDASAFGGFLAQDTAFDGGCSATWAIDLAEIFADEGGADLQIVEIWARMKVASGMGDFRVAAMAFASGLDYAQTRRYTEHGSEGRPIPVPLSNTNYYIASLGTITLERPKGGASGIAYIRLEAIGSNSGATFGFDWMAVVGASRRALSPTGKKPLDGYPGFAVTTASLKKSITHDLRGFYSPGNYNVEQSVAQTSGLSGSPIEFDPGRLSMFFVGSRAVPDDPDIPLAVYSDSVVYTVTLNPTITPRWHFQRPN